MPQVIRIEDQNQLVPTKAYPHAHWPFENFNPVQSRLIETFEGDSNIALAAQTSAGKAQPLNSPILTPKGWVKMGAVRVNDKVISSRGLPTEVTGVFPQGKKTVYRVVFSDGATADCCEDHLWAVRTKYDKCENRPFRVKSLKDLFGDLRLADGQNKWFVPLIEPVMGSHKEFGDNFISELPLEPYVLGVLLGDGGIKHRIVLSSADEYIINEAAKYLPEGVLIEYLEKYDYQIVGGMNKPGKAHGFMKTNLVKEKLQELGLFGLGSCDKFIPQMYLDADTLSRLEILHGLMDTDGTANGEKAAEFSSCSSRLAEGVCQLARSLGAATKVRKGKSSYRDEDGNIVECEPRYRVTVNLGNINPFSLPRKVENQKVGLEKGRNRSIERIEVVGVEECQCIQVAASDHLYVTSDYVLTHNTVSAEMYMAYETRVRKGKALYIGPLKALAAEKRDDWTNPAHHFNDMRVSICTGDYRLTNSRIKELDAADVIVMTPEMLASRCRNHKSEKSNFLKDIGTVVFDESHLLTVPGRGDHIEIALMKITEINPNIRVVLLSATMPNMEEICGWVSKLTQRDTFLLESKYRPCPLSVHYESYFDGDKKYEDHEREKVGTAVGIVKYYSDDKFLVFVHTKRTGELTIQTLKRYGIDAEFHNANLDLAKRQKLEKKFKEDPNFRVIVATSTLAWGLNLPARRVVIVGVDRGLSKVENYDIWQMAGRAGRPAYDPRGDVYILVPESKKVDTIARLKRKDPIKSQLLDDMAGHHKTLAFHLVSEIHQNNIKTREGFHEWFKRSLAFHQNHDFGDYEVDKVVELLTNTKAVAMEGDEYKATSVGVVASMFYFSPFDAADLRKNFKNLFEGHHEKNDYALALALADLDSYRFGQIVNKAERTEMAKFQKELEKQFPNRKITDTVTKFAFAYHNMLNGIENPVFSAVQSTLRLDSERTMEVLNALDTMSAKWKESDYFKTLKLRMAYGVKSEYVNLVQIPNVGRVRAEKLYQAKIRTVDDFVAADPATLSHLMNIKVDKVKESIEAAKTIKLENML